MSDIRSFNDLTPGLQEHLEEYAGRNQPEVWLNYQESLGDKHTQMLLDGKRDECYDDLYECYQDSIWDAERYAVKDLRDEFSDELEAEIADEDWEEIALDLLTDAYLFSVSLDIDQLIRNTRAHIVLRTNLEYWVQGWLIYRDMEYEDLREILSALFINPRLVSNWFELSPQWPNYAYRNDRHAVDPDQFCNSMNNCPYGGEIVVLMDYRDGIKQAMGWDGSPLTIKKGSNLLIHDYVNGSGGLDFDVVRDFVLKPEYIYGFQNDDGNKYGVQSVHGMTNNAWNSEVEHG